MNGEAAAAAIQILVQNLIDVSKEEISLNRGLEENVDNLKGTLDMIQTSLDDAQKKFITDKEVKRWVKELEAVVFDADNVLDELHYQLLSKKMKSIHKKKKNVSSCFPSFNQYVFRRRMALKIKEINTSLECIDKRATKLGLERRLADAPAAHNIAASETDSFTVDPIFVGRDDDVSKIVGMLTTCPTEEGVSILPIVGMGGLGKTTLARKVFNHDKIKTYFGLYIWVHVSQNFDALTLLKKILKILKPEDADVEICREVVLKKIQEALKAKTYVLVLDDVWNEDQHKWEGFINSWSGITSTRGNVIIVTTRNTEVGSIVNTLGIHHLNGLSEEECWSIIKDRAFRGGDFQAGVEAIGRSIAERCHGLPLAANVVGGVLRDKSQNEWLSVKENWLSDVCGDENNISRILRLSFDHLSSPSLKKCFAYCSIFPKGIPIERENLIQLWMAEGFLHMEQKNDMENVGNKFADLLVQSSLLQVVERDEYNNVMICSMHDLVHDVAASVLGFPEVNHNTSGGICQARYVSWHSQGDESSRIPKEQTKWLRTLFYRGEISDIVFSDYQSLHALILSDIGDAEEMSDSIRELIHLRYLDISNTCFKYLPDSIGELHHLQTLKARNWRLEKLPSTFKYLFNLRHLEVRDDTEMPPHLGMLTSLQTLQFFNVRDEDGHRITELGSLKNLKGELKIDSLEEVQGEEDAKKAYLFQKSGILELLLTWGESREGEINDENVLKGLQPHPNLKLLEIYGFQGASFPLWTLKMASCLEGQWVGLNNLTEIRLACCGECEEIPTMGHLPQLKSLYLGDLENVKSIGSSFYGIDNCSSKNVGVFKETINVFPVLERLGLGDMPKLTEWATPIATEVHESRQVKIFPRLKFLRIRNCKKLRSAPSQFPSLKIVKIEEMDSGIPLANICGAKLTSLVKFKISGIREMVCLPDWLFHNSQNLSVLQIRSCPKLSELPDGLQTLNSLKELTILSCQNLKSIQYSSNLQSRGSTLLRKLSIDNETVINFLCEMIESCASSLLDLKLYGSVNNTTMTMECARKMLQHLTALSILHLSCFGIEELPEWFGNLSSLKELKLSHCKKLKSLPSVEVMRRFTKLTQLTIKDCPELKLSQTDAEWPKISHIPNIRVDL